MPHQNKDKWYWTHKELNKLVHNWELIPGCPPDEFDKLIFKLLSLLQKPFDDDTLFRVLESELIVTYGLSPTEDDIRSMANEIKNWWTTKQ